MCQQRSRRCQHRWQGENHALTINMQLLHRLFPHSREVPIASLRGTVRIWMDPVACRSMIGPAPLLRTLQWSIHMRYETTNRLHIPYFFDTASLTSTSTCQLRGTRVGMHTLLQSSMLHSFQQAVRTDSINTFPRFQILVQWMDLNTRRRPSTDGWIGVHVCPRCHADPVRRGRP
jgi:hypothetical protein